MKTVDIKSWIEKKPQLEPIVSLKPTLWLNPLKTTLRDELNFPISRIHMDRGKKFMEKYAPYIAKEFPSLKEKGGILTSPLVEIEKFKKSRAENGHTPNPGRLFLKCDNDLPVAGSIKARGGFLEVLHFAHELAVEKGLIKDEEAGDLTLPQFKELFSQYTIGVGSTGNLGMSIGIISARLGFKVNVYMSHDAKEWKKQRLRENGANVIEEPGDFSVAIAKGRENTQADPKGYFVDDENSKYLFLGYSLAAFEIKNQLDELGIITDAEHPLVVHSPCGVGGSPGGVLWGMKNLYGDNLHTFFVEPTHSPSVLLGLITGKLNKVSVQDFGIDNRTEADGLAVGRPSAFASSIIEKLVSGIYTIEDSDLFVLLKELYETEKIFVEPSATSGLPGAEKVLASGYFEKAGIDPSKAVHIAWSTGGGLIPSDLKEQLLT